MYGDQLADAYPRSARQSHRAITVRIGNMTPDDEITLMNSCSIEHVRRVDDVYTEYELVINGHQLQEDLRLRQEELHKRASGTVEHNLLDLKAKDSSTHEKCCQEAIRPVEKVACPHKDELEMYKAKLDKLTSEMRHERARLNVSDYREDLVFKRRHDMLSGDYERPAEHASVEVVCARISNMAAECRALMNKSEALDKKMDVLQEQTMIEDLKWRQLKQREMELNKYLEMQQNYRNNS